MTTPKIERLIEAVKFFASSDENQIRPTTRPLPLKEVKAALLDMAHQAEEDWKSPHAHPVETARPANRRGVPPTVETRRDQ
jgi:hypothetical protein